MLAPRPEMRLTQRYTVVLRMAVCSLTTGPAIEADSNPPVRAKVRSFEGFSSEVFCTSGAGVCSAAPLRWLNGHIVITPQLGSVKDRNARRLGVGRHHKRRVDQRGPGV